MQAFKESYKGFEIIMNSFKMSSKMFLYVFISLSLIYVSVNVGVMYVRLHNTDDGLYLKYFYKAEASKSLSFGKKTYIDIAEYNASVEASEIMEKFAPNVENIWASIAKQLLWTSLIFLLFPVVFLPFVKRTKETLNANFIRGTKIVNEQEICRAIVKESIAYRAMIGNIPLPVQNEPKSIFAIGRPGCGKTVLFSGILNSFKMDSSVAGIVYDYKGDYTERFYIVQSDLIFNPFDERTLEWNVLDEVKYLTDIDMLAKALIPEPHFKSDPYWNTAARDVFISILRYCYIYDKRSNKDIWDMLRKSPVEIEKILKSEPACSIGYKHIYEPDSKQAMAVFAVMMQYARVFEYMQNTRGTFSISEWVKNPKGWIFINNHAEIKDALRPVLSLFVEVLINKFSALSEDYNRRIVVSLDELPTLHKIETLVHSMNVNRGRGIAHIVGTQDKAQLDEIYDQNLSDSIINACGNSVVFSVADPNTADYLSKKIGDAEVEEVEETQSMGVAKNRDGVSLMKRKKERRAVLPSELMNLMDLVAYVKLSNYNLAKTQLVYKSYKKNNECFIIKDNLRIENIRERFAKDAEEVDAKIRQPSKSASSRLDRHTTETCQLNSPENGSHSVPIDLDNADAIVEVYSGDKKIEMQTWKF